MVEQEAAAELAGKVEQLLTMGFTEVAARAALQRSGGHMQTTVDMLLGKEQQQRQCTAATAAAQVALEH